MQEKLLVQELKNVGWTSNIAELLASEIIANKFSGKSVAFDFDNTVICGDIGERILSQFSAKYFQYKESHKGYSPSFPLTGKIIDLAEYSALDYYNHFLSYSALSFEQDPHYKSIPYAWAVQVMAGLPLSELMKITEAVFPYFNKDLKETAAKPFIYPAMLKLISILQKYGFQSRFISASNVWSVRKIILEVLNPKLQELEAKALVLEPESVVGLEVLLQNKKNKHLYKDTALLKMDSAYAHLDKDALKDWLLSPNLNFPITAYEGKVAAYQKHYGNEKPLFCFGDTTSDLSLLEFAEKPIWIARIETPEETEKVWNGWNGKAYLGAYTQPIDSMHLQAFLSWEHLQDKTFLDKHPLKAELQKSLEILAEAF